MVNKKITQLSVFWIAIAVPVFFSVSAALVIVYSSDLVFDPSYMGFNKSVEVFRVPIGLLSLVFPFVALVAAYHRSDQTAMQIRITDEQNTFANYFSHREEYFKVLKGLEEKHNIRIFDANQLYKMMFPFNSVSGVSVTPESGGVNVELFTNVEAELRNNLDSVQKEYSSALKNKGFDPTVEALKSFYVSLVNLSIELKFVVCKGENIMLPGLDEDYYDGIVLAYNYDDCFLHACILGDVIKQLEDFCHVQTDFRNAYYSPSQTLKKLAEEAVADLSGVER